MKNNAYTNPSANSLSNDPDVIDRLPAPIRDLIHEFGWSVVRSFLDNGVTKAAVIRHLIYTVWMGAREPGNKRPARREGAFATLNNLDDFLLRAGPVVTARALVGLFRVNAMVLLPREPYPEMAETSGVSMNALRVAFREGERKAWPFLQQ